MSSYQTRPATRHDVPVIAQIHADTLRAAYNSFVPDDFLASVPVKTRQKYWGEAVEFGDPQVHVATLDGKVVGFVGFDRSRDRGTPQTTGEIWSIYVLPEHWGRGAGLALWDAASDGLVEEGCTKVTVWVPLANARALRFHELAGFQREMSTVQTVAMGPVRIEEIRLQRSLG